MTLRTTPQGAGGAPAGGGFETDLHVMVSAQQYLAHVGQVMVGEVNRMMAQLEAMDRSQWDGLAATAFVNAKLQWHQASIDLQRALADIGDGLDSSRRQYDQAELDNQLGISGTVRGLS